jgi:hypothetical protein
MAPVRIKPVNVSDKSTLLVIKYFLAVLHGIGKGVGQLDKINCFSITFQGSVGVI